MTLGSELLWFDADSFRYEVDETNEIKDVNLKTDHGPLTGFRESVSSRALAVVSSTPFQWRSHEEVAIEVTEYQEALAIHGLVDENNTQIVAMKPCYAIIQGFNTRDFYQLLCKVEQALGGGDIFHIWKSISHKTYQVVRHMRRVGGLVDIHHRDIRMDRKTTARLMARSWTRDGDPELFLVELRVANPYPVSAEELNRELIDPVKDIEGWKSN
ncbi:hypothetical protein F5Y15DRAFT_421989 [Xylariaceae sp. FL0016]|nr:hypothetical protein F5Y15DRAFT_421989 [Xylariaceae sp. FL0016]